MAVAMFLKGEKPAQVGPVKVRRSLSGVFVMTGAEIGAAGDILPAPGPASGDGPPLGHGDPLSLGAEPATGLLVYIIVGVDAGSPVDHPAVIVIITFGTIAAPGPALTAGGRPVIDPGVVRAAKGGAEQVAGIGGGSPADRRFLGGGGGRPR